MKSPLHSLTLIIIGFSFLILTTTACSPGSEETSTLVYGLTLAPTGIDPHLNASSELGIPLRSVYDTLVFLNPETGEFIPGLAKSWTISPDGLTYIFTLRPDVTFHDGTPFNAQAVLANLDRIRDPDNHSQKAVFMLGPLEDVEIIDDDVPNVVEVDHKLVMLGRQTDAPIMTNDFNLNQIAKLQGVTVLNINMLANAVRAEYIPGEIITLKVIQEGKEHDQGVGYLQDGTMVVVENGKRYLDRTIRVEITRLISREAGKMYFAKPADE